MSGATKEEVKKVMEDYIEKVKEKSHNQEKLGFSGAAGYAPLSLIIFRKYDVDGDGTLSFEEFKNFTEDKGYFFSTAELITAFSQIDDNEDGEISYDEFRAFWANEERMMHMQLSPAQQKQVTALFDVFAYFDESKDGNLDFEEFKNLFALMKERGFKIFGTARQAFDQIDINGDKNVQFTELLRYFVEKHGILDVDEEEEK